MQHRYCKEVQFSKVERDMQLMLVGNSTPVKAVQLQNALGQMSSQELSYMLLKLVQLQNAWLPMYFNPQFS